MVGDTADADQAERTGTVAQRPVEQAACELADPFSVVGADLQRCRPCPIAKSG
jgi:hypothetical protein